MTTDTTTGSTRTEDIKQEGKEVFEEAKAKTTDIGREAKEQGRQVLEEMKYRARDQADGQARRAAESLRGVAAQLGSMAELSDEQGMLVDMARNGADQIQRFADRLGNDGVDGLLTDVEQFARRRPGLFLAATFGAGMVLGRLVRASDPESMRQAVSQQETNGGEHALADWRPESAAGGPAQGSLGTAASDTDIGVERMPGA